MKLHAMMPVLVAAVLVMASCTKDPVNKLSSEETRLYITNHDSTANFSAFTTFSIEDSVAVVNNDHLKGKSYTPFDSTLIAAIATQMKQMGYTQVSSSQSPSLGINVNNITNTSTGLVDYGDYYSDYYSYWDPYDWGYGGYGYYSPFVGVYQVSEGVISIDMFDLKDAAANGKLKSVWNGVLRGDGIFNTANVNSNISALFAQSPYLKH